MTEKASPRQVIFLSCAGIELAFLFFPLKISPFSVLALLRRGLQAASITRHRDLVVLKEQSRSAHF